MLEWVMFCTFKAGSVEIQEGCADRQTDRQTQRKLVGKINEEKSVGFPKTLQLGLETQTLFGCLLISPQVRKLYGHSPESSQEANRGSHYFEASMSYTSFLK
jgi:hypothetical protein